MMKKSFSILKFLGLDYVCAYPLLAGNVQESSGTVKDYLERDLSIAEAPSPVYFINAALDKKMLREYPDVKFDYILGSSDVGDNYGVKYPDRSFVYWTEITDKNEINALPDGSAIVVKQNSASDWFYLRRTAGVICAEEPVLKTKTLSQDNEIIEIFVDKEDVVGIVRANHSAELGSYVLPCPGIPF